MLRSRINFRALRPRRYLKQKSRKVPHSCFKYVHTFQERESSINSLRATRCGELEYCYTCKPKPHPSDLDICADGCNVSLVEVVELVLLRVQATVDP